MQRTRYPCSPGLNKCAPRKKPYTCAILMSPSHLVVTTPSFEHTCSKGGTCNTLGDAWKLGASQCDWKTVLGPRARRPRTCQSMRCSSCLPLPPLHRHAAKQRHTTHNCTDANGPASGHECSFFHTVAARFRELVLAKQIRTTREPVTACPHRAKKASLHVFPHTQRNRFVRSENDWR